MKMEIMEQDTWGLKKREIFDGLLVKIFRQHFSEDIDPPSKRNRDSRNFQAYLLAS
jgi:hypothetical protein